MFFSRCPNGALNDLFSEPASDKSFSEPDFFQFACCHNNIWPSFRRNSDVEEYTTYVGVCQSVHGLHGETGGTATV